MNKNVQHIYNIASKKERIIIGLMSGTSLDGLDIALCKFSGTGFETNVEILQFVTVAYDSIFKEQVQSVFSKKIVDLEKLSLLNEWIAEQHAIMINNCLKNWGVKNEAVDLIASHGQTIYHAPKSLHQQNMFGNATLQIGDGDHLAVKTGIITLSDFRQKHIAAGGEGAPLAMHGDYLLFNKEAENRIMLNIGGIANFTYLPGNRDADKVFSTDTGPGNTLMDAYIQKNFTAKYYDENAAFALQGNINHQLLEALKQDNFFKKEFPKTTGPELFNLNYVETALQDAGIYSITHFDMLATLNMFTADTIVEAILKTIGTENCVVYASGGGMHNPLLMQNIKHQLPNCSFKQLEDLKINPDAKEALLFAVLANESICGGEINYGKKIPSVSMGKISFPA